MSPPEEYSSRILVVEDDDGLRDMLRHELEDAGYQLGTAPDADAARRHIGRHHPDLVISDLRLPGDSGRDLLDHCRKLEAPPGFIMITAFGTVEQAVEALRHGADDFLTKPLRLDHLRLAVARVLNARRLRAEVMQYRKLLDAGEFHGMVGRSAAMRTLFDAIRQVAPLGGPVIVSGESGTGKELVARAVHAESPRRDAPFVPLNCAAMPPELMESELFGHTRGAFTGATQQRPGLFVEADGGTLLLDEIGEMRPDLQAKLLRVLEDGCIRPLGSDREVSMDVRLIAATNRDLETEVAAGRFREDLFFRLETFPLAIPPLRERGEDLDLLAAHFIERYATLGQRKPPRLSAAALDCLKRYRFPGNVRELGNALERATAFCDGQEIKPAHLPERIRRANDAGATGEATGAAGSKGTTVDPGQHPRDPTLDALLSSSGKLPSLESLERRYIRLVLERTGGNKRQAAEILGIGRRTLYRRLDDGV